jgi:hypothetical protein
MTRSWTARQDARVGLLFGSLPQQLVSSATEISATGKVDLEMVGKEGSRMARQLSPMRRNHERTLFAGGLAVDGTEPISPGFDAKL